MISYIDYVDLCNWQKEEFPCLGEAREISQGEIKGRRSVKCLGKFPQKCQGWKGNTKGGLRNSLVQGYSTAHAQQEFKENTLGGWEWISHIEEI